MRQSLRQFVGLRSQRGLWSAFFVALAAMLASSSQAQAGVIVNWNVGQSVTRLPADLLPLVSHEDGAGSGPQSTAESPETPSDGNRSDRDPAIHMTMAAMQPAGGASAPTAGSTLAGSYSTPVATVDVPACASVARAFRHWRERSPRLPEPLSCEMLDPPRS